MPLSREKISIIIAIIPPLVMILGAPLVLYAVEPRVLGMPFNLFWHVMWLLLGPVILTIAYLIRVKGMEGRSGG
jgi:hypothetical protein